MAKASLSTPATFKAACSVRTAFSQSGFFDSCICKCTPMAVIIPTFGFPGCWKTIGRSMSIHFHPASASRAEISFRSPIGSLSACADISNGTSPNFLRASTNCGFAADANVRGTVSLANVSLASAASFSSWAARAFSSAIDTPSAATCSSDILCSSAAASAPLPPYTYSAASPAAIRKLANTSAIFSPRDISWAKINRTANSSSIPNKIASVAYPVQVWLLAKASFRAAIFGSSTTGYTYLIERHRARLLLFAAIIAASLLLTIFVLVAK
jgi:hypothetical protein